MGIWPALMLTKLQLIGIKLSETLIIIVHMSVIIFSRWSKDHVVKKYRLLISGVGKSWEFDKIKNSIEGRLTMKWEAKVSLNCHSQWLNRISVTSSTFYYYINIKYFIHTFIHNLCFVEFFIVHLSMWYITNYNN